MSFARRMHRGESRRGAVLAAAGLVSLAGVLASGCGGGAPGGGEVGPRVAFVELAPTQPELYVGGSLRLEAYPTDEKGEDLDGRKVRWWSGDPKVATVDASGLVQGVSVGRTVIAVDVEGVQASVLLRVHPAPIGRVALVPDVLDLYQGRWTKVGATAFDIWGQPVGVERFEWRSSAPEVASVDSTGRVEALEPGAATIYAAADGIEGSASVTVRRPRIVSIEPEEKRVEIYTGRSRTLRATAFDETGEPLPDSPLNWRSEDPQIASVESDGLVRAWRAGHTAVVVSAGTVEDRIAVDVLQMQVEEVDLFPAEASVIVGDELVLTASVIGSDGDPIFGMPLAWSSSDPSIATVSSLGLVSTHEVGEVSIIAEVDGVIATARLSVERIPPHVARIRVEPSLWVREGDTAPFPAVAIDQYGDEMEGVYFSFSSNNPRVASVFGGVVHGWEAGSAIITTTARSVTAQTIVNVLPPREAARIQIHLPKNEMILGEVMEAVAIAFDENDHMLFPWPIAWSSSDPSVATVDGGAITAVGVGEVTITAAADEALETVELQVEALRLVQIDVGPLWSCGLTADGRLFCWGELLPHLPATASDTPIPVGNSLRFRQISVGDQHLCGITTSNEAYCMGDGREGQLGNGALGFEESFVPVAGGRSFRSIGAGSRHSCAITLDGAGYCWGAHTLGAGESRTRSLVPIPVETELELEAVTASGATSCAIAADGSGHCWGENPSGELGNGTTAFASQPTPISGGLAFDTIESTSGFGFSMGGHGCGLDLGGSAYCWGSNALGQLGTGDSKDSLVPKAVAGGTRFDSISVTSSSIASLSCGITRGGGAMCWGHHPRILLDDGSAGVNASEVPLPLMGSHRFSSLRVGSVHFCGIDTAGITHCWGETARGRTGVKTQLPYLEAPTPILGQLPPAP